MHTGSSLANMAADAKREPQVSGSVTRLSNMLERISNQVDLLESRISPALRPTQPTPAVQGNRAERPHEVKAPVAESIDALTERAAGTEMRLNGIIERVEL